MVETLPVAVGSAPQPLPPPEPPPSLPSLAGKRVLIATESLGPVNGVTRATASLQSYLHAQGVATITVAPETGTDADRTFERTVRLPGVPLPYNPELRLVRPFNLRGLFRRVGRPDVIYLASPATLGLQLWLQVRHLGIPVVANFQTDLATYARLMLPRPLRRLAGWSLDCITGRGYRDGAIRVAFCPSTQSRDYLLGLGVPESKIRLLGRGVDCTLFDRRKRSAAVRARLAPHGEVLLLCVSRLSLEKGYDLLAAAYRDLAARAWRAGVRVPFRLVITGGNANPEIERGIRALFAGTDTHFTGVLTGEDLAAMYASADLFVFPSRSETFGQVVQEAMASGLPVVAQRAGGPADLVVQEQTGLLVPPGDAAAFADATLRLLADDTLRARMGRTARAVAEHRGWDAVNARITTALAEVAN